MYSLPIFVDNNSLFQDTLHDSVDNLGSKNTCGYKYAITEYDVERTLKSAILTVKIENFGTTMFGRKLFIEVTTANGAKFYSFVNRLGMLCQGQHLIVKFLLPRYTVGLVQVALVTCKQNGIRILLANDSPYGVDAIKIPFITVLNANGITQALIQGGTYTLPKGYYILERAIVIPPNTTLKIQNATIEMAQHGKYSSHAYTFIINKGGILCGFDHCVIKRAEDCKSNGVLMRSYSKLCSITFQGFNKTCHCVKFCNRAGNCRGIIINDCKFD